MTIILAAIDDSAAARPVLEMAVALSHVIAAKVEAVHVADTVGATARAAAHALNVPLRSAQGDPLDQIARMANEDEVFGIVLGARARPTGRRPAGHVALALADVIAKPIVIVPPEARPPGHIGRVLIALEGTARQARALQRAIDLSSAVGLELIVVHVDDETSIPMFIDQVQYETESYSREFMARYCPGAPEARLELRVGTPIDQILAVADEVAPDMLAIGWPQSKDPARGHVAREIVNRSRRPVLLAALANHVPT